MTDTVVTVDNLSKRYLVGHRAAPRERYTALRDVIGREARQMARRAVDLLRGRQVIDGDEVEEYWALKGVSFEVKRGEVLGIVGRNGAGKSTLLKILSRITEPTDGRIVLRGRIGSLLEVGTGFHPELTGRENIFLNGAILGMRRAEIQRRFDEIVAFSEVERFLDTPVKRYSSGMYVRLAFAVAAHLDPEILVVDEVLAVGDAEFQKKCLGKMKDVASGGRTVLFVSHNMNAVERLCHRALWLDRGHTAGLFGDVREGILKYLRGNGDEANCWTRTHHHQFSNEFFSPLSFQVASDEPNFATSQLFSNRYSILFAIRGRIETIDPALNVGIALYTEHGSLLFWSFFRDTPEDQWPKITTGPIELQLRIPPNWLNEGAYRAELIGGLHYRNWLFEPGGNGPSVGFTIQGGMSESPYWLAKRPGFIAPVLRWEALSDGLSDNSLNQSKKDKAIAGYL
jgi:lipopolysaccharide transport system ATP-binding protein